MTSDNLKNMKMTRDLVGEVFTRANSDMLKSRREGLLALCTSLEEQENLEDRDVYDVCLQMAIDGTDHDIIREIGENLIHADHQHNKDADILIQRLKLEAVLSIQRGDNPRILFLRLWSMTPKHCLPEGALKGFESYMRHLHGGDLPE